MSLLATNPCAPEQWSCSLTWQVTGNEGAATFTGELVSRFGSMVLLVVIVVAARWLLHRLIDRFVRRAETGLLPSRISRMSLGGGSSLSEAIGLGEPVYRERRVARARTVGSVLKSVVSMILFTVLVLMLIAELGFSIAPLLTSAGIVGIALGFGAQTLVKDFLSGLFLILEDQYGVGDTINLGDPAVGTVEAVSLRVTRLRDASGVVWYVRNGEILRVGNKSQQWARAVVDVTVPYAEDLDRVRTALAEVGAELRAEAAMRAAMLDDPEVAGIEDLTPETVTVRVLLRTVPNRQDEVARAYRDRVRSRFVDDGITLTAPPA